MAIINLENDVKITTFRPPSGFDPLTASARDLAQAGFPPRPTDAKLLARYQRFFNRTKGKFQYIEPTFRVDPTKTTHTNKGSKMGAGTETSDNWSGGVVYAPSGESFAWVQGDWVIPDVYPTAQDQWQYCANWIGLDGDGSGDVCQAGMICSAFQSGSSITRNIYPFHEWYPSSWVEITNLLVSPGDLVSMLICTQGAGSTTATIYFGNQSSGLSTSYQITAPSLTKLVGNSAEWIVETPIVNGVLSDMPDYGQVFFSTCEAYPTNGGLTVNGGTGNNINLVQNNTTLSTGTLVTPTIIECQYAGPAPTA
jgi:hypothetical protein